MNLVSCDSQISSMIFNFRGRTNQKSEGIEVNKNEVMSIAATRLSWTSIKSEPSWERARRR
jgi:hypothetical protein